MNQSLNEELNSDIEDLKVMVKKYQDAMNSIDRLSDEKLKELKADYEENVRNIQSDRVSSKKGCERIISALNEKISNLSKISKESKDSRPNEEAAKPPQS